MMTFKPWDIWLANVKFYDSDQIKRRPVIILQNGQVLVLALFVTSHNPRYMWGEYALIHWQYAGLKKPSTVRLSLHLQLKPSDLIHRLGSLHADDILNIQRILASKHK